MAKGIAIFDARISTPHQRMAEEALREAASRHGYELDIQRDAADPATRINTALEDASLTRIIVAGAELAQLPVRSDARLIECNISEIIRHPEAALGIALEEKNLPGKEAVKLEEPAASPARTSSVRIVAVTSCPTGIAHTFMAAAALQKAAAELGYQIHVETQGSVGAKNPLTEEEIRNCSVAIIAADRAVDPARFANVRLLTTSTKDAIHHGKDVIARALALSEVTAAVSKQNVAAEKKPRTGAYKHLMNGVSHMLPLVTAGGLLIAIAFAIGGVHAGDHTGTLGWALMQIGGATAFKLYIAVLSAFIASSIADRPGLAPGLIGGMLSTTIGAGFLGGIIAGFLAGYVTKLINEKLPLPESLQGLKPVLILPVLSTLIVGLSMIFVIGTPVKLVFDALTAWLAGMQQGSALLLGALLAGMMAFDMGGPVNKAAYAFSVGMLASNVHGPMAATMAGGMTPPLAIALASVLFKKRFTKDERSQGKVTAILGLSFVTEGAIPFAASDPLRILPCLIAGSALTGAISMGTGCELMVPHGGAFVLLIPNAVTKLSLYALAIVSGTVFSALLLGIVKRKPQDA